MGDYGRLETLCVCARELGKNEIPQQGEARRYPTLSAPLLQEHGSFHGAAQAGLHPIPAILESPVMLPRLQKASITMHAAGPSASTQHPRAFSLR